MNRPLRSIEKESEELPKYLYKYFSLSDDKFSRIEEIIGESKLYFAQPKSFNDPFDCNIPLSFKGKRLKLQKYWKRLAQRIDIPEGKQMNSMVKKNIELSRTVEGKKSLNRKVRDSTNKNGVASFSTDNNNTLMWAYYAAGHTGVSLRFNMDLEHLNQIKWDNFPVQVDYREDFPEINYYEIDEDPSSYLARYLGTKSIAWKHEKEWRIISVGVHGLLGIPNNMLDGIIFGLSTTEINEKKIRQIVAESKINIEFLRVVHKKGSYELEVVPA